jgi:hypothetical protein
VAYVYLNPLKQQLENARQQKSILEAQLRQLYQDIEATTQQIAQWDAYIAATAPLAEVSQPQLATGQTSLADLCRMALNAYGRWVTAQEVRAYFVQLGIRLDYNNEMAVLHNTLKRVGRTEKDASGNTIYAARG